MKKQILCTLAATFLTTAAWADGPKVEIKPDDTAKTLLERQVGHAVEVRLKNGDKLGGKVESVSGKTLHLSALSGQEFFDALIEIDEVSAVLVRTK